MMLFRSLILLVGMLIISTPAAFAQEADWDKRLDDALNAPYPNDQIVALTDLYESETDPQNKLVSAYWIAVIAKDLKRYNEAAEYGEAALSLSDTHFRGNLQQRDAIVAQLVEIYFRDEKTTKAEEIIDANLELNDAMIEDIWFETSDGLAHRYSGMVCPNRVGNLYREKTHNFHPAGIDVGCNYKEYNGEDNAVTLYLTQEPIDEDIRTPHEKAMAAVNLNWGDADILKDTIVIPQKSGSGTNITESLLRIGSIQKGYRYTGTWTSDINGWTLKSRITWDGSLKQKFGETHAIPLLSDPTTNILPHLEKCRKRAKADFLSNKLENDSALSLMALTMLSTNDKTIERPEMACLERASKESNVIVESYEASPRAYSLVGEAIDGDLYLYRESSLALLSQSSLPHYIFRQDTLDEDNKPVSKVLAIYQDLPSSLDLLTDFVAIFNGNEKILGSIVRDNNGNTTIKITPKVKK